MEATWCARRAALHCLSQQHPDWSYADLAAAVGGSEGWVKKWLARFSAPKEAHISLLYGYSLTEAK
jgi:hypothetical protein